MKLSLEQIGKWLGCSELYSGFATGFKQDSRLVEVGDLFFALPGEKVDGHAYLHDVALKGAIGAVVSSSYTGEDFGLQLFRISSVLNGLHSLAKQVHLLHPCRVIGVTGSVGKTTTKEFIATLLEGSYRVGKTPGNANSQVGMPLSLLNAQGDEQVFVVEMGMSESQEIEKLVAIAPPEIALITAIALSHALFFSDGLEGIARAKAEIFSSSKTRFGLLSQQALVFSSCKTGDCDKVSYGFETENCDFALWRGTGLYFIKEEGISSPLFTLPFSATHLCENFTAAACIARLMGVSWDEIVVRAQQLRPFSKRFERVEKDEVIFMNDSYNANPLSMKAALHNLPSPSAGCKRIAVLGAMRELGSYEADSHTEVALEALHAIDHLLCLGKECEPMVAVFSEKGKPVELFTELNTLKSRLFALIQKGDVVLLKGSNSNKLWQILD